MTMEHPGVVDLAACEAPGHRAPTPIQRHLGTIVEAATAWPYPGLTLSSAVACRRRPGHQPCTGRLRIVRNDNPLRIVWGCPECEDQGAIANWRGTRWDLGPRGKDPRLDQATIEVHLTDTEHGQLCRGLPWDHTTRRVVMSAQHFMDMVVLWGTVGETMELYRRVTDEAANPGRRIRRYVLDAIAQRIAEVLDATVCAHD
jgi:hypothetical protein